MEAHPERQILCPHLHTIKYKYDGHNGERPRVMDVLGSRWDPPINLGATKLRSVEMNIIDKVRPFRGEPYLPRWDPEEDFNRLQRLPQDGFKRNIRLNLRVAGTERLYSLST
jgi:hypothetical protein